jgi:hypothetical protein
LASIFDEFTFIRVKHHISPISGGFNVSSPGATFLCYDDDGGVTAATIYSSGAPLLCQYPTCKMFNPAIQGATLATEANSTGFRPIEMEYSRTYNPLNAASFNTETTGWVDCASPNNLLGSMYYFNGSVSGSNSIPIFLVYYQYEVAFRFVR